MNVIGNALNELYRIFAILNAEQFGNALPEPVITIYKTKGNILGHFTVDKTWRDKNDVDNEENSYYEINIDPRWFAKRTPVEVVETLLHEMCHYRNKIAGIKDCNGNNHNKKFKVLAESVGLVVEKGSNVGWGYTSLSDYMRTYIEEVIRPDDKVFEYFRTGNADKEKKPKSKTMFKSVCPDCGQIAKGKADISIRCGLIMAMEEEFDMEIEDED